MSKSLKLKQLNQKISLLFPNSKLVFGSGNLDAEIAFVGEAPGRAEEISGRPFVGRAGKLLDAALGSAGMKRGSVYVTNVVKFRPVKGKANRAPSRKEIEMFVPSLLKELEIMKPKIICALGAVALQSLTGRKEIAKLRGKVIEAYGWKILPVYHPAAVLRFRKLREKFFSDIRKLKKLA